MALPWHKNCNNPPRYVICMGLYWHDSCYVTIFVNKIDIYLFYTFTFLAYYLHVWAIVHVIDTIYFATIKYLSFLFSPIGLDSIFTFLYYKLGNTLSHMHGWHDVCLGMQL